jgi:hypothetical protein
MSASGTPDRRPQEQREMLLDSRAFSAPIPLCRGFVELGCSQSGGAERAFKSENRKEGSRWRGNLPSRMMRRQITHVAVSLALTAIVREAYRSRRSALGSPPKPWA